MRLSVHFERATVLAILGLALIVCSQASLAATQSLTISGTPATIVAPGEYYWFTPTVSSSSGKRLRFTVANKPSWAYFSSRRGTLYGKPRTRDIGVYSNIVIAVSDGTSTASLAPFNVTVGTSTSNTAPTITGSPATAVTAGQTYSFQPSAADANGDALAFSITNKPAWAAFSTTTGKLSGTPDAASVGSYANIIISVSDGKASTSLAAFTITVNQAPTSTTPSNTAPTITGSPATAVTAGQAYSFQPSASDAEGDALTFAITSKPAWATFSTSTGRLSGTPTAIDVGSYANIVISVSDGKASTSLTAFTITVKAIVTGAATLTWEPPLQNTDGSALTNLAGYRILYGTSSSALTQIVQVPTAGITSYTIENLAQGTWYFSMTAYTTTGMESVPSALASKTIQ